MTLSVYECFYTEKVEKSCSEFGARLKVKKRVNSEFNKL